MPTITLDRRTEDVRPWTRGTQEAVAAELASRARAREGKHWAAIRNLARLALVVLVASGCATTYRPALTTPGALTFQLTPEQCLQLKAERRHYRATEQASGYVAGASALVTLLFLPLVGEKTAPALTSGVGLLAGGALAWTGAQVNDLDTELTDGGCK